MHLCSNLNIQKIQQIVPRNVSSLLFMLTGFFWMNWAGKCKIWKTVTLLLNEIISIKRRIKKYQQQFSVFKQILNYFSETSFLISCYWLRKPQLDFKISEVPEFFNGFKKVSKNLINKKMLKE